MCVIDPQTIASSLKERERSNTYNLVPAPPVARTAEEAKALGFSTEKTQTQKGYMSRGIRFKGYLIVGATGTTSS